MFFFASVIRRARVHFTYVVLLTDLLVRMFLMYVLTYLLAIYIIANGMRLDV